MLRHRSMELLLLASLLASSSAVSEGWYAFTSDNFTLYSDAPEDDTRELVEKFEIFRDSALAVLGLPDQPENQRLVIVVFGTTRDFGRIRPRYNIGGFYYDSLAGPRMLLKGVGRDSYAQQALFHEYVHYLMRERSSFNYPRWYFEGLATVLETTEIEDQIVIGRPPVNYPWAIGLNFSPSVREVVTGAVDIEEGFYLTAWQLSHYVSLGDPAHRQQTLDYLRRHDAGEDPVEAFETSYGITTTGMDAELAAYARRRTLTGLFAPRQPYTGSLSTRELEQDEVSLLLGGLAIELDAHESAHHYFDEASEAGADSPFRTKLMGRRAIAYIHEKRVSEGDELMTPLLEEISDDPQVLGDVAHYAFDKFVEIKLGRSAGDMAADLERAIEYGVRAVQADPANLEAHYYLGLSYEAAGRLQNAADELLDGYDLGAPPRFDEALARVLIKGRQYELASYLLTRMVSANHADEWRRRFRSIIVDLEDGEATDESLALLAPPWEAAFEEK
jgi:tetratricopeptide (TPR) repeat protein